MATPPQTLAQKITDAADRVRTLRARRDGIDQRDLPLAIDVLANLEAQALGKAPGWEEARISGLVPTNPYLPKPAEPPAAPEPKVPKRPSQSG